MTKRVRTILFCICFCLFLVAAPLAIFYSQGYRFDFENKKIVQTGGIFLKVSPKQTDVYLDDKLIKKTDFFFDSVFIGNLLPKKYKIRVEKNGYYPWEKVLEIKEKEVTEAKNIVLFPKNPNFEILTKGLEKFWFSPDGKKIIFYELEESGWALKLFDLMKNVKSQLIGEKDISKKEKNEILNLEFSFDSTKIFLEIGKGEELKYFILNLTENPPKLISLDFLKSGVDKIFFNPRDSQKLLVLKDNKLSQTDLIGKEISPPLENILTLEIFDGNIYYLDKAGFIFKTDFSFVPKEKINFNPFPLKEEVEHRLHIFPDLVFLEEEQVLYLENQYLGAFEKFFEPIKDLKISPDLKKITYFSDYEIWIFSLEWKKQQFLLRFSEKIQDIFWLTPDYLIFNVGNKTKIAEIDDRDKINIVELSEFPEPEIFFNQIDKKLYLLSNKNFYSSEKLLP